MSELFPVEAGSGFVPVGFSHGTPPVLQAKSNARRPLLLQVAQLGDPVLRQRCDEIPLGDIPTDRIQFLIDDLIATCRDVDGVGISAPQIYVPLQLFIIASNPNPRYPNAPKMEPTAIINPTMISASEEKEKDWEGCLSIPGLRGLILRPKAIKVKYLTRNGAAETREFDGFVARVFQHEFDHIKGILITDKVDRKDLATDKEYMKIIRAQQKV